MGIMSGLKNSNVLSDVIKSLAVDAAQDSEGVKLSEAKRNRAVSVCFLPNEKVTVDVVVNIDLGYSVPSAVAGLQEKIKKQIEGATKFKVHSVNVEVANVNIAQ